jgi:hypothetical protein
MNQHSKFWDVAASVYLNNKGEQDRASDEMLIGRIARTIRAQVELAVAVAVAVEKEQSDALREKLVQAELALHVAREHDYDTGCENAVLRQCREARAALQPWKRVDERQAQQELYRGHLGQGQKEIK